ncbi:MAG: rhodanese-like domain-containing protein [Halofilum sp. (in: g-proteobacteria)]|nr:rhodanese-like domain-containing protein [Halofilum sp. (in: g-proteobacteria)]
MSAGTGAADFGSAARVYWILRLLGHDDVAILDGGFRAWEQSGHAVAGGWNEPEPARFEAELRPGLIADTGAVAHAREAGARIVDVRPARQYRGEEKHPQARAAGRIPGAVNLEQDRLISADSGSAVTGERLAAALETADLEDGGRTITVCNTGHFAAIGWFMLSEVAGREDVAVYDGSMIAWAQDPERPLQVARSGIAGLVDWLVD